MSSAAADTLSPGVAPLESLTDPEAAGRLAEFSDFDTLIFLAPFEHSPSFA